MTFGYGKIAQFLATLIRIEGFQILKQMQVQIVQIGESETFPFNVFLPSIATLALT
jgi:hypothetical protein